jgi:hypothetical protein
MSSPHLNHFAEPLLAFPLKPGQTLGQGEDGSLSSVSVTHSGESKNLPVSSVSPPGGSSAKLSGSSYVPPLTLPTPASSGNSGAQGSFSIETPSPDPDAEQFRGQQVSENRALLLLSQPFSPQMGRPYAHSTSRSREAKNSDHTGQELVDFSQNHSLPRVTNYSEVPPSRNSLTQPLIKTAFAQDIISELRRPKCKQVWTAISLALGGIVGDEYWSSAQKLKILQDMGLVAVDTGAFASAFSNAAQTIYFLNYFPDSVLEAFNKIRLGEQRNYGSKASYIPFFMGRSVIAMMAFYTSFPVILAASNNPEIGAISWGLLTGMNYDSVTKVADRLCLSMRPGLLKLETALLTSAGQQRKFRSRWSAMETRLRQEKEIQYVIGQILKFLSTASVDEKRALKDILHHSTGDISTLQAIVRYIKTLKDPTNLRYFNLPTGRQASSALPSMGWMMGISMVLLLLCFFHYALNQFPAVVVGTSKTAGQGDGAPYSFGLGLMAMGVSLVRYADWASKMKGKFSDAFGLLHNNPRLYKSILTALVLALGVSVLSPGGSIEGAVKGLNSFDQVNLYGLTPYFDWVNQTDITLPISAPTGFISGSVINSPGNMTIAVGAVFGLDYLVQLFGKSNPAHQTEFVEALEDAAIKETLLLFMAEVGDNRRFSDRDIAQIDAALKAEINTKPRLDPFSAGRLKSVSEHNASPLPAYAFSGMNSPVGRMVFLRPESRASRTNIAAVEAGSSGDGKAPLLGIGRDSLGSLNGSP